jgi:hypothetical protein
MLYLHYLNCFKNENNNNTFVFKILVDFKKKNSNEESITQLKLLQNAVQFFKQNE